MSRDGDRMEDVKNRHMEELEPLVKKRDRKEIGDRLRNWIEQYYGEED